MNRFLTLGLVAMLALAACSSSSATPTAAPSTAATPAPTAAPGATPAPATPAASANPEAVIEGVEPGAEISFWTYYLSPTFDDYIKGTIARFEQAYPGVKVNWADHQATFLDDYRNSFAAGNAPDVANLSDTEGWVREFASKGLLLSMTDNLPDNVKAQYFPGLFNLQLVGGKSYQVPWYQAIAIELINTQIYTGTPKTDADGNVTYTGGAGLKVEDFPKTYDGIPALCKTIVEKTGKLCDLRLTVTNLLADMTYQGGVKAVGTDGKFAFNSPEGVAWLQMYVDMVKDKLVDKEALVTADDRIALDKFIQGEAAFYQTGPQLIRQVRSQNPGLYGYLAAVPLPPGKSGANGPTSMAMSVKADTKYPKASLALATFFTNPQSMLEFSKIVGIYPSTPASYEDEFFTKAPVAIEE
ncbi:MAG TPA: extracellular solute-binding protein, partial [Candidatus Limnocylindrales bacterium]